MAEADSKKFSIYMQIILCLAEGKMLLHKHAYVHVHVRTCMYIHVLYIHAYILVRHCQIN